MAKFFVSGTSHEGREVTVAENIWTLGFAKQVAKTASLTDPFLDNSWPRGVYVMTDSVYPEPVAIFRDGQEV